MPAQVAPKKVTSDKTTEEVVRFWEQWRDAIVRGDLDAMRRMMAPDFTSTHSDAIVLGREEYIQVYNPTKRKIDSMDLNDVRVRFYGNTAIVNLRVTIKGRDVESQKDLGFPPFQVTSIIIKQGDRWEAVAAHVSRVPQS